MGDCLHKLRKTTESFIEEAKAIHGNKYDYSHTVYKGIKKRIKVSCTLHGDFTLTADKHLHREQGCPKCVDRRLTHKEDFVEKSTRIYGSGVFDYSLINDSTYNSQKKQPIICVRHNEVFYQRPNDHQKGKRGCPQCQKEHRKACYKGNGGWSHSHWASMEGEHKVYFLLCELEGEKFVKIGKTTKPISKRFTSSGGNRLPYNYKTLFLLRKDDGYSERQLSILEKDIHRALSKWSYTPKMKFRGSTECFSVDCLRTKVVRELRSNKKFLKKAKELL